MNRRGLVTGTIRYRFSGHQIKNTQCRRCERTVENRKRSKTGPGAVTTALFIDRAPISVSHGSRPECVALNGRTPGAVSSETSSDHIVYDHAAAGRKHVMEQFIAVAQDPRTRSVWHTICINFFFLRRQRSLVMRQIYILFIRIFFLNAFTFYAGRSRLVCKNRIIPSAARF